MAENVTQLRAPYSGYLHRELPKEDEVLTHVGPGTPCGEYLRRFWQPVTESAALEDLPKRVRMMGEDLVAFRDRGGRVGLLELHCAHRGTSLEFGLVSDRGITCCYHGWQYDVDGKILATPGEPPDSTLKDRLYHGAYPTHEFAGLIFTYMGPPDKIPPFPNYDTFDLPGYCLAPRPGSIQPCNWLQIKENCMDPVHTAFLHTISSGTQFSPSFSELGTLDWIETPVGMIYIHTRRIDELVWVHIADFLPPNIHQFPPVWEDAKCEKHFQRPMMTNWAVPLDDDQTLNIGLRHIHIDPSEGDRELIEAQRVLGGEGFGQTADRTYDERQRVPGDYDAQTSQRPIAIHSLEHLGTTDRGITMMRKQIKEGIRAVQKGEDPKTLSRDAEKMILTYSNDTIIAIPRKGSQEEDDRLIRETGLKVAKDFLKTHPVEALAAAAGA